MLHIIDQQHSAILKALWRIVALVPFQSWRPRTVMPRWRHLATKVNEFTSAVKTNTGRFVERAFQAKIGFRWVGHADRIEYELE